MNINYWHFILLVGSELCFHFPFCCCRFQDVKEDKREELFESLKANESIGWEVDVIDPRELSAKMLKKLVRDF